MGRRGEVGEGTRVHSCWRIRISQFIKAEAICAQMLNIMAVAFAEVVTDDAAINAKLNPSIHAEDQAYKLALKEGTSFREAHKQVTEGLKTP